MTLRELSSLASATLVIVGGIWYIYAALRGDKVKPVLASWIILGGTMTLSFATYWTSPRHSLISNGCNAGSVITCLSILATAFWIHLRNGDALCFSGFQKWCLIVSGLIASFWVVLVWGFHGTGIVPNILTQVLMIVGYVVTAKKLWRATKNTESFFTWTCITVGCAIAIYTGIVSPDAPDALVILYGARATISSATIVWLMYRIERKSAQTTPIGHCVGEYLTSLNSTHQK